MTPANKTLAMLAVAAMLSPPAGSAASYFYRGKPAAIATPAPPKDTDPDPVSAFPASVGAAASSDVLSATRKLSGHDGIQVSVSGAGASYRLCPTEACTGQGVGGWSMSAAEAPRDTWVQLKVTAAAQASGERVAILSYGGRTASWSVTTSDATGLSISAMGIADANLAAALDNALGNRADWVKCLGSGATESCVGAKETLVVWTGATTGVSFGLWTGHDLEAKSCDNWRFENAFFFTNAPSRAAYLMNGAGTPGTAGKIKFCGNNHAIGLYYLRQDTPLGFATQTEGSGAPNWTTGYRLTGASSDVGVNATVSWYKRK
jgi:hypothetical protein